LRGCDDVPGLLASFTGSDRYVPDYLMEEVFQRQPADLQAFLLETSVLDRMTAPLCEAVTGCADSDALLLTLEQRNLFVVPLDRSRQWYRYHHLFGDLLRHRLELQAPDSVAPLHDRACHWYAENRFPADAVRHALAARTWEEAAALILRVGGDLLNRGEIATLLGWYRALPDSLIRSRSELCAGMSWPLILSGQVDEAEDYLASAEDGIEGDSMLAGTIAAAQAYIARIRGDDRRAVALSERALALLPADDWQARGVIATNLGLAYWYAGGLDRAEQVLGEEVEMGRRSGNQYAGLAAQVFICKVKAARGNLGRAAEGYRHAIRHGGDKPFVALAHADLAKLLLDRNELAAAAARAGQAVVLSRFSGLPEIQIAAVRTLALVEQARGEQAAAAQAVAEIEQLARHPDLSPMALSHALAYRILIALMAGDPSEARHLADRSKPVDDVGSLPDYALLSLAQARVLLAEDRRA
jgi:LuxR family maltose regulon positive regulatory protein